jgi:anthranilate phosphoribosyltransferase
MKPAPAVCLERTGFTFLFAPHYHPAMKAIAPVRQALGVRTVFNVLGPLTNPAAPPFAVVGAFNESTAELMAEALAGMPGLARAFVIHGANGWDEPTPLGPFTMFDVRSGRATRQRRSPAEYGLEVCAPKPWSAAMRRSTLPPCRRCCGARIVAAHRDALVMEQPSLSSARAAWPSRLRGWRLRRLAIDDGRAAALLDKIGALAPMSADFLDHGSRQS